MHLHQIVPHNIQDLWDLTDKLNDEVLEKVVLPTRTGRTDVLVPVCRSVKKIISIKKAMKLLALLFQVKFFIDPCHGIFTNLIQFLIWHT